ncbi:hypothetical protein ACHAWF_002766, partial [Thalassiosira exigua]
RWEEGKGKTRASQPRGSAIIVFLIGQIVNAHRHLKNIMASTTANCIAALGAVSVLLCLEFVPSPVFAFTSPSLVASPPRVTARVYAAINIDEEAPRDIASFEEWASYGGVQRADGFQLVGQDLDGFLDVSAMTTQDMPAGSPVVYVPSDTILSSSKAMEEFGRLDEAEATLRKNGYESEIRQYYLMLKILSELEKGEESPWFHYLNSLPRFYSNGASMTVFCYTCIPPFLASLCKEDRARLNNLSIKRPVHFLSNDTKGDADLWKFAYDVVCKYLPAIVTLRVLSRQFSAFIICIHHCRHSWV